MGGFDLASIRAVVGRLGVCVSRGFSQVAFDPVAAASSLTLATAAWLAAAYTAAVSSPHLSDSSP